MLGALKMDKKQPTSNYCQLSESWLSNNLDHFNNHICSSFEKWLLDERSRQDTQRRFEIDTKPLQDAIDSLKKTLNEVCLALNRSLTEENFCINKPFVIDGKTYYHPVPGERALLRPKHPFEVFEADELPLLNEKKFNECKDMKIFARRDRALAYFFYKHKGLSNSTKNDIGRIYRSYLKETKRVSYENICIYMRRLDSGWSHAFHYLNKIRFCLRKLVTFSYRFNGKFPEIRFNTKTRPRVDVNHITESQIWRAHRLLLKKGDLENALLLRLMFTYALMPFELRTLRFEDIHTLKNGSNVIRFYHPRSSKLVTLKLPEELFKEIQNYEQKVKNSKAGYEIKMRTTFKNKRTKGHFLFYFEKKTIFRRFRSGFNNKVPNFSYSTTEIRAAAKFNQLEF